MHNMRHAARFKAWSDRLLSSVIAVLAGDGVPQDQAAAHDLVLAAGPLTLPNRLPSPFIHLLIIVIR